MSCGGCISTKTERILDFSIDEAIDDTVYGATFTYKSDRKIDIISDRPVGHNVMRDKFDHFLVNKAREAGAEVLEGRRVTNVTDSGDRVTVKCANGESFSAKFLIGADGAAGFVGRTHFGLDPKQVAVSVTAEVPYDRDSSGCKGRLFIDFGSVPYGYAWVFPKKKFLSAGIAGDAAKVGGQIKRYFDEFLRTHPSLKGLSADERVGWIVPIYYTGAPSYVKGRVALAGDTGHLVDPFSARV